MTLVPLVVSVFFLGCGFGIALTALATAHMVGSVICGHCGQNSAGLTPPKHDWPS